MPRASSSTSSNTRFADPKGPWIIKTQAYSEYHLGPTDLDSIQPISIGRVPDSRASVHKYNRCDVRVLHAKIAQMVRTLQVGAPAGETVPESGDIIFRTQAKNDYKLHDNQIDRIRPCRSEPNRHNTGLIRRYNVSDVKALARGIASLRDMPAPEDALAAHGADPDDSFEDLDYNPYDGMSPDDAAAHLAGLFNPPPQPQRRSRNRATPY